MNERAAPPEVKVPDDPKGLVTVRRLLATEQVAAVLIPPDAPESVHVPETRVIDVGKRTVICELEGIDVAGYTVT